MNNDQTSNSHQAVNSRSDLQATHGVDSQANN